jgi:hypothetical protein
MALNTGGGLEGILVNYLTSDKEHHWTSPSTGFPLIFLCLHKEFLFLFMFTLNQNSCSLLESMISIIFKNNTVSRILAVQPLNTVLILVFIMIKLLNKKNDGVP